MYYYAILALVVGALALCSFLLHRRTGYYWRAIREDEAAAASLGIDVFRWKIPAPDPLGLAVTHRQHRRGGGHRQRALFNASHDLDPLRFPRTHRRPPQSALRRGPRLEGHF